MAGERSLGTSYLTLLLIGVLAQRGKKGVTEAEIRNHIPQRKRVTVYVTLSCLEKHGMVERGIKRDGENGRKINSFLLTEKGRRYAIRYRLALLVTTPSFVPYTEFE